MYNVASCWLYLKEYINDARSHGRQAYEWLVTVPRVIKFQNCTTLLILNLPDFIHRLIAKVVAHCPRHPNHVVQQVEITS